MCKVMCKDKLCIFRQSTDGIFGHIMFLNLNLQSSRRLSSLLSYIQNGIIYDNIIWIVTMFLISVYCIFLTAYPTQVCKHLLLKQLTTIIDSILQPQKHLREFIYGSNINNPTLLILVLNWCLQSRPYVMKLQPVCQVFVFCLFVFNIYIFFFTKAICMTCV